MRCQKEVRTHGLGFGHYHQCTRRAVEDGFCKLHHPDAVAKRDREKRQRWDAEHRSRMRGYLMHQIGALVLNALEDGGQMHAEDYSKLDPSWCLERYVAGRKKKRS